VTGPNFGRFVLVDAAANLSVIRTATTDRHYCSHRHLTAGALVRSRAGPCEICGGQSGNGTVSPPLPKFFISPLSVPFHHRSVLIFIHMSVLPERQAGETWRTYKSMLFRKSEQCIQKYFLFTVRSARCLSILTIRTNTHSGAADRGHKTASSRQACGRSPATVFPGFPLSPSKRSDGFCVSRTLMTCTGATKLYGQPADNVTPTLVKKQILKK